MSIKLMVLGMQNSVYKSLKKNSMNLCRLHPRNVKKKNPCLLHFSENADYDM